MRFAVIGDYGVDTLEHSNVAALVKSWEPDFIVTTGDNIYFCGTPRREPEVVLECSSGFTLEERIGQSYGEFIEAGRFWPTVGNHEYRDGSGVYHAIPYRRFFDLPGDELTYTVSEGPVQFFFIDNGRVVGIPPKPVTVDGPQAAWLKEALATSTAAWKVVVMHMPPYDSFWPDGDTVEPLRWPYKAWGADLVFAGHGHHYERLEQPDGLPVLVNGLGGHTSLHIFKGAIPESRFQYTGGFGGQRCESTAALLSCSFINTDGEVIDTLTLERPPNGDLVPSLRASGPRSPTATATATPTPTPSATGPLGADAPVRFAVIGDYGVDTLEHSNVAALVKSWEPDFIVTTGDNHNFCGTGHREPEVITECTDGFTLEERIGQSYGEFIEAGRFWPTVGDHEYRDGAGLYHAIPYRRFFDLPGDELTYTIVEGPVQFFFIDTGRAADIPAQPVTVDGLQAEWLEGALATSTAAWKVIVMHNSPYNSFWPTGGMVEPYRWPYKAWGADLVLAGQGHHYERLEQPDGLPVLVNGLGGHTSLHIFKGAIPESRFQYTGGFGGQRCEAWVTLLSCSFVNTDGQVIDTLTLERFPSAGPAPPP